MFSLGKITQVPNLLGTEGAMVPPKPEMAQAEARLVPDGCDDVQHLAALLTLHALTQLAAGSDLTNGD